MRVEQLQTVLCAKQNKDDVERLFGGRTPTYNTLVYEHDDPKKAARATEGIVAFVVHDATLAEWYEWIHTFNMFSCSPYDEEWVRECTIPRSKFERALFGDVVTCREQTLKTVADANSDGEISKEELTAYLTKEGVDADDDGLGWI